MDDVWAADLNGDGLDEVIVGYNGGMGLHVLDSNGKLLWKNTDVANVWHVAAGNVDGDGRPAVVTTSATGKVHIFNAEGKHLRNLEPGFYGNMVRTWEQANGNKAVRLIIVAGTSEAKTTIAAMSPQGEIRWSSELSARVGNAVTCRQRPWLALTLMDGSVRVINLMTGKEIARVGAQGDLTLADVAWLPRNEGDPLLVIATSVELKAYRIIAPRATGVLSSLAADSASSASPVGAAKNPGTGKASGTLATVSATGTIEPEEVLDVGARVAGPIVRFGDDPRGKTDPNFKGRSIDYGSPIEKGTLLAEIEQTPYKLAVAQQEVAVARAEAELTQVKTKSELAKQRWKLGMPGGEQNAKAAVTVAEASLRLAKLAMEQAKTNLANTLITSSVKGVILARSVNVGQTVTPSANASLFLIAKNPEKLQVWASVNEADIGRIHKGMAASFTVDEFPQTVFKGRVTQVRMDTPRMQQNVVTYTVVVSADNPDSKPMFYKTVNVQFEVKTEINSSGPKPLPPSATGSDRASPTNDAIPWGEWNASWSVRLRAAKPVWNSDEWPKFIVDLRKRENSEPDALRQTLHNWLLEVDGRKFRLGIFTTSQEHKQVFELGSVQNSFITFRFHRDETGLHIRTGEHGNWINSYRLDPVGKDGQVLSHPKPEDYFAWTPGKHIVRIAFPVGTTMLPKDTAISNPVEVRIQLEVNVYRDGAVTLGKKAVTLDQLTRQLAAARQQYSDLSVLVHGDERAKYENVQAVLNACKQAGIQDKNLSITSSTLPLIKLDVGKTDGTPAAIAKLESAEQLLKVVEARYKAGNTTREEFLAVKRDRDVAAEELKLDAIAAKRAMLEYAEARLQYIEKHFKAGYKATQEDFLKAKLDRDTAAAELNKSEKAAERANVSAVVIREQSNQLLPQFGPEVEQNLDIVSTNKSGQGLDLVDNRLNDLPKGFNKQGDELQHHWCNDNCIDLFFSSTEGITSGASNRHILFLACGRKCSEIGTKHFENITDAEVAKALVSMKKSPEFSNFAIESVPVTLVIETNTGSVGVLEIHSFAKETNRVGVRYKKVAALSPPRLKTSSTGENNTAPSHDKTSAIAANAAAHPEVELFADGRNTIVGKWKLLKTSQKAFKNVGSRDGKEFGIPMSEAEILKINNPVIITEVSLLGYDYKLYPETTPKSFDFFLRAKKSLSAFMS